MSHCVIEKCQAPTVGRGWCRKHYARWHKHGDPERGALTFGERLWAKVDAAGPCWLWTGSTDGGGYGLIRTTQSGPTKGVYLKAHRAVYELLVGPIPKRKQLDHLCRVRNCVNPDHLEPVTARVNTLRGESFAARNAKKTHCGRGHEFSPENTYITPKLERQCRTCLRAAKVRYLARKNST